MLRVQDPLIVMDQRDFGLSLHFFRVIYLPHFEFQDLYVLRALSHLFTKNIDAVNVECFVCFCRPVLVAFGRGLFAWLAEADDQWYTLV